MTRETFNGGEGKVEFTRIGVEILATGVGWGKLVFRGPVRFVKDWLSTGGVIPLKIWGLTVPNPYPDP